MPKETKNTWNTEPSMLIITSNWGPTPSFKLMPITENSPFIETNFLLFSLRILNVLSAISIWPNPSVKIKVVVFSVPVIATPNE